MKKFMISLSHAASEPQMALITEGDFVQSIAGELTVYGNDGDPVSIFSPGAWLRVTTVEPTNDKGA